MLDKETLRWTWKQSQKDLWSLTRAVSLAPEGSQTGSGPQPLGQSHRLRPGVLQPLRLLKPEVEPDPFVAMAEFCLLPVSHRPVFVHRIAVARTHLRSGSRHDFGVPEIKAFFTGFVAQVLAGLPRFIELVAHIIRCSRGKIGMSC